MVGSKHIDRVKNMNIYHCMTFFNWSPFVRRFMYNKPKFKSMHSSDHTDTTSNNSVTSRTHKVRLKFSSIFFFKLEYIRYYKRGAFSFPQRKKLPRSAADILVSVAINGIQVYVLNDFRRVKVYAHEGSEGKVFKQLFVGYRFPLTL